MQTPPPFHGYEGQMPPKKPKTNGIVILFAVLGVLLICCGLPAGLIGYGGFKIFKGATSIGGCFGNVSLMTEALEGYQAAHNGKLPNAKTWQTDIAPYFKTTKKMKDSPIAIWTPTGEWSCEEGGVKTGFAFNSDLSGQNGAEVAKKNPEAIAIFETKEVGFNQASTYKPLPFNESPKIFSDFTNERRGWLLVTPDAHMAIIKKSGKMSKMSKGAVNMDSGFNFDVNDEQDSGSGVKVKTSFGSDSSNDDKADNSN